MSVLSSCYLGTDIIYIEHPSFLKAKFVRNAHKDSCNKHRTFQIHFAQDSYAWRPRFLHSKATAT